MENDNVADADDVADESLGGHLTCSHPALILKMGQKLTKME